MRYISFADADLFTPVSHCVTTTPRYPLPIPSIHSTAWRQSAHQGRLTPACRSRIIFVANDGNSRLTSARTVQKDI